MWGLDSNLDSNPIPAVLGSLGSSVVAGVGIGTGFKVVDSAYKKAKGAKKYPITKGKGQEFSEIGVFEHEGKQYSSGGSELFKDKNGKLVGLFYASGGTGSYAFGMDTKAPLRIGTWDGSKKVPAIAGHEWRDNFGSTRQTVYFKWDGIPMTGTWFKSQGDIVRAKQTKS